MLIWVNGPFGGGKTHTAHELTRRLPGATLSDPEHPGFGFHRMLPPALRRDFQDLRAWRAGVAEVLDQLLREHGGVVVVPMTLTNPAYYDDIIGQLRHHGHDVHHFALLAHRDTVVKRLWERGLGHLAARLTGAATPPRESWAIEQLDLCLERLTQPKFTEHIWTDNLTIAEVANHIAHSAGLHLTPNTDTPLRGWLRRKTIGIRHIRF
ncbi:AAA family ATPase [Actinokineospora inagensis]|uniref:AAA family ATPase n=1 Tax=Actinokineospora inagensis TaxID=103730 RepID=UPI00040EDF22|nr:AAA family ATPase [Actinokineospora inagensis]